MNNLFEIIKCTISTPQFKNKAICHFHIQEGKFNEETLLFEPYIFINGNHKVQFSSLKDFEKARIKS